LRVSYRCLSVLSETGQTSKLFIIIWNNVLVPKYIRWKHILVDGLTLHSEAIFPTLLVKSGDEVVDAGYGFGDTAIKLARLVGPSGSVLAVDCCDAFLELVARMRRQQGLVTSRSWMRTCRHTHSSLFTFLLFAIWQSVFREPRSGAAQYAENPQARRHHDDDRPA
jgi:hypothetical protein